MLSCLLVNAFCTCILSVSTDAHALGVYAYSQLFYIHSTTQYILVNRCYVVHSLKMRKGKAMNVPISTSPTKQESHKEAPDLPRPHVQNLFGKEHMRAQLCLSIFYKTPSEIHTFPNQKT